MPQAKLKKEANGASAIISKKEQASLDKIGKKCIPKNTALNMKNLFGKLKKTERPGPVKRYNLDFELKKSF